MKNSIYQGHVLHHRINPKHHRFNYRVNYFFFDINKPEELITFPPFLHYQSKNYLTEKQIKEEVLKNGGQNADQISSIYILTQLSYFGFCFNPVSFYYCYSIESELLYIVSQITNTPWGEKHVDCLNYKNGKGSFRFSKNFHVSPFMPMEIDYQWHFNEPAEKISIQMTNTNLNENEPFFIAHMELISKEMTPFNVTKSLLLFPLMSLKTIAGIYWQALKLYLKQVPFYSHPKKREAI